MTKSYIDAGVLVGTEWVTEHLNDPSVAFVEVNTDLETDYRQGHVPEAIGWGLHTDLEDQVKRDIPGVSQLVTLLGSSGIDNDTTIVLYGDGNNRSATWAFWVLKYYRHGDTRLMNGGRKKWLDEGRPLSTDTPSPSPRTYKTAAPDRSIRAMMDFIVENIGNSSVKPLDTRTFEEYTGQLASAPGTPQSGIYRKGRIPGAVYIPWEDGTAEDGAFKPVEELRQIYESRGLMPSDEIVTYCLLGIRASYSWFILKHLLGYPRVRNYDGSWIEWGNVTGVPIEKGE